MIKKEGKKMRCKVVAGLVFGLWAGSALADDLMSVYRDAVQQDPIYAGAKSAYTATKEKLPQGRALFLPNINATANYQYNEINARYGGTQLRSGNYNYPSYGAGLNLSQPLFRPQNFSLYD